MDETGAGRTGSIQQEAGAALEGELISACGPDVTIAPPANTAKRPRRPSVAFSAKAMREVVKWVAAGEPISVACRRPGLPTHNTVNAWAKASPVFRAKLNLAREAAGWMSPTHQGPRYCEAVARTIYARLCAGESLSAICADPAMPGHSTVYRWRGAQPEFAALLREARAVQAEATAERCMEIADAITPGTAYATEVRLKQYRWTAGVYNPAVFGRFRPVNHESVDETPNGPQPPLVIRAKQFNKVQGEDGRWILEEVFTAAEEAVLKAGGTLPPPFGAMRHVTE